VRRLGSPSQNPNFRSENPSVGCHSAGQDPPFVYAVLRSRLVAARFRAQCPFSQRAIRSALACSISAALVVSVAAQTYTVTNIGPLSGGTLSSATDINSSGQIASYSNITPSSSTRATLSSGGTLTNLGAPVGGTASWAWGLNDSGTIAGNATSHAFRYDLNSGTMPDLGTLGGANSTGYAINANGWVVGTSDVSLSNFNTRAFLAKPGSGLISLSLGGSFGGAYGINNSDVIVGSSLTAGDNNTFHAFIYQNGVMTDLNSLIAPSSGWLLNEALAINDAGQIVATAPSAANNAASSSPSPPSPSPRPTRSSLASPRSASSPAAVSAAGRSHRILSRGPAS